MLTRFFYRILCGFFLGVSVFAPGFSGSIVAIIMGIYQDLLRIISNPFKSFKQNVKFCAPLAIGAAISAVLFVLTFKYLFETYEKATYLLFVGLVAGNLPIIFADVKKCGFQKRYLIAGTGAFAVALALGVLAMNIQSASGADIFSANWLIFMLGGLAGGITMLVPGMSVSMVLIVMGVYNQLILAAESLLQFMLSLVSRTQSVDMAGNIDQLNFTPLIQFSLFLVFAVIGLVSASRGIKYIFEKYPGFSNSTVLGFMSGSLIGILVKSLQMNDANFNWLLGFIMLAVGLGISMLFVVLGKTMNKTQSL